MFLSLKLWVQASWCTREHCIKAGGTGACRCNTDGPLLLYAFCAHHKFAMHAPQKSRSHDGQELTVKSLQQFTLNHRRHLARLQCN